MIENNHIVIEQSANFEALHYFNRVVMYYNNMSFQELPDSFDNHFENTLVNNAWNLERNAEKLQEILNRVMQGIGSIITSALLYLKNY